MKRIILLATAFCAWRCDQDAGATWPDSSTDSWIEGDTDVDLPTDMPADQDEDAPLDTAEDTGTGDVSDGSGGGEGPTLLYDGAVGSISIVPGWSASRPRPVIVLTRYSSESTWHVSMAEIDAAGVVGGMATDVVRVWGWGDFSAYSPSLLYEGPRDGSAIIASWSWSDPCPLVVLSRYSATDTWFVSMAQIDSTGLVGGMVTDEIAVWGWTSPSAAGSPGILYEGGVGGSIAPWNASDPDPLIVMTTWDTGDVWWLSMADVSETGAVSGMLTDSVRVFGW